MPPLSVPPSVSRFRLRELADDPRCFPLPLGTQRVGSSPQSDVHLPVTGVSREHALILVTPEGLSVEDRGSKNGTFVDGRPVERHALSPGARLEVGPVVFEVEEVEAADVELALRFDEDDEEATPTPSPVLAALTSTWLGRGARTPPELWLALLDGFAGRLFTTAGADPGNALVFLNEALGLRGSCLVEPVETGEPRVVAARGRCGEVPALPEGGAAGARKPETFRTTPEVTVCCLNQPGSPAIVVWGDFAGRPDSEVLFRLLLRYAARIEPSPPMSGTAHRSAPTELVFPSGYVPGISPPMAALYRQMKVLASSELPVLVVGETGVGKEHLAAILHLSSARRGGPLVSINCAAIPADLLEAELFGIGKGVATGVDARPGKFQLADGGTLFLDEIGEMLPALQAKLLRALQEKQVQPVGGRPRQLDVRIVAATNADLDDRMERGEFRRDLYYRLAGSVLDVPPLRRRPEDLPVFVEHFLRELAQEAGVRLRGMTVKALERLAAHDWPGNVRELRHEIRRLVHACGDGGVVDAALLPSRFGSPPSVGQAGFEQVDCLLLEPRSRELEIGLIREALRRAEGMQIRAAKLLGISRNGLADKVKRLGIDVGEFRTD